MTKTEVQKKGVLDFITANPGCNIDAINRETKIAMIVLHNILKSLFGSKLVRMELVGDVKTYLSNDAVDEKDTTPQNQETLYNEGETEEITETLPVVKSKKKEQSVGKNFNKYKFQGVEYNKGRLALEVIRQYAKDCNPTLAELQVAFPEDIIKPFGYGTFRTVNEAKKVNDASYGRIRFFLKEDEIVKLKDKKIAVTNQWTQEILDRFLSLVRRYKYVVKAC